MRAKQTILLVDDAPVLPKAMKLALEKAGYGVIYCDNGEAALEAMTDRRIDLIISDLRMPGIGGIELVGEAKKRQPWLKAIVMTAYGSQESVVAAMRAGVSDFIEKPFRLDQIRVLVEKLIGTQNEPAKPTSDKPPESPQLFAKTSLPTPTPGFAFVESRPGGLNGCFCAVLPVASDVTGIAFGEVPADGGHGDTLQALVKAVVCAEMCHAESPQDLASRVNQGLWECLGQRQPVKLFCAFCDLSQHRVSIVNCGGLAATRISGEPADFFSLPKTSMPLGLFPNPLMGTVDMPILKEDRFIICSGPSADRIFERADARECFLMALTGNGLSQNALSDEMVARAIAEADPVKDSNGGRFALLHFQPSQSDVAPNRTSCLVTNGEEHLAAAMALAEQMAQRAGLPPAEQKQVVSATAEATICALCPRQADGASQRAVQVDFWAGDGEVAVEVDSQQWLAAGEPSDNDNIDAILLAPARSLQVMRAFMDAVVFESQPELGAKVHMLKQGTPNAG